MVKGLLPIESFLLVYNQQLANKILALLGNGFKLSVVEVELRLLNLTEHFWRTSSLERQVAADKCVE